MNLLVDGHNLIGQIPDISLADPDDEAKLVMRLRSYATRKRGRQVVVVFDHGVYGHPLSLDGYGVKCYFARSPQDADTQLIRRIQSLPRPREWMLVTSDREVARVGTARGMRVISSHTFAAQLRAPSRPGTPADEKPRDVRLSAAEIREWMEIFGFEEEVEAEESEQMPAEFAPLPPKPTSTRNKRNKAAPGVSLRTKTESPARPAKAHSKREPPAKPAKARNKREQRKRKR